MFTKSLNLQWTCLLSQIGIRIGPEAKGAESTVLRSRQLDTL